MEKNYPYRIKKVGEKLYFHVPNGCWVTRKEATVFRDAAVANAYRLEFGIEDKGVVRK